MRYFTQGRGEDDLGRKNMLLDVTTEETQPSRGSRLDCHNARQGPETGASRADEEGRSELDGCRQWHDGGNSRWLV